MSVYPESLVKISEASIRKVIESKGQNLKIWTRDLQYSEYDQSFIVGINVKTANGETTSENIIIPAYDFIEKVADAVVLEFSELKNALASSDIKNIFIGKDITMTEDVTIAGNKTILGINSILNLNGRAITLGANNLDAYCKVDGTTSITGTGTVWFKDVLCTSNNTAPITYAVNDPTKKTFERFVDKSDYYITYKPTGWTQKFVDNTFPWKDLIDKINTDVAAEAEARANAIRDEAGLRSDEDTRLAGLISDETSARTDEDSRLAGLISDEETRATNAESGLGDRITAEANARSGADTALRNSMDALEGGGNQHQYVYGIDKNSTTGALTRLMRDVDVIVDTKATEDYAVPTVKAVKDYVDGSIHAVYKPKGEVTKAQLETSAFKASADKLGFVYNFKSATAGQRETVTVTASDNTTATLELEDNEDLACVLKTKADPSDPDVYIWNDFGGKIDLSNYYTKAEVEAMSAAATTSIANDGNNTTVTNTTASDNSKIYHIHSEKTTISAVANKGIKSPTGTRNASTYTTDYALELDLAQSADITDITTNVFPASF